VEVPGAKEVLGSKGVEVPIEVLDAESKGVEAPDVGLTEVEVPGAKEVQGSTGVEALEAESKGVDVPGTKEVLESTGVEAPYAGSKRHDESGEADTGSTTEENKGHVSAKEEPGSVDGKNENENNVADNEKGTVRTLNNETSGKVVDAKRNIEDEKRLREIGKVGEDECVKLAADAEKLLQQGEIQQETVNRIANEKNHMNCGEELNLKISKLIDELQRKVKKRKRIEGDQMESIGQGVIFGDAVRRDASDLKTIYAKVINGLNIPKERSEPSKQKRSRLDEILTRVQKNFKGNQI
jgi:hypothetical protein